MKPMKASLIYGVMPNLKIYEDLLQLFFVQTVLHYNKYGTVVTGLLSVWNNGLSQLASNRLINSFWMSATICVKQPGYPET